MPTVAAIIIGNEILTGKFADENGVYLIARCRELGADIVRLVVIPDVAEVIAREVRHCSELADLVVTSGGVGPTHDDITLESIALAFGVPVFQHPDLVALLHRYDLAINDASLRMATVPEGTQLLAADTRGFPVVRVKNVYVLPGVPKLFASKFERVSADFKGEPLTTARVFTKQRETEIAAKLQQVVDGFPSVSIGSYPRYDETDFRVVVTLEGRNAEQVLAAEQALCKLITFVLLGDLTKPSASE